jgi:hypothetical protein
MAGRTSTSHSEGAPPRLRRLLHGLMEYVGMVMAMVVGMVALGLVRDLVAPGAGLRADLEALVMATEMVVGMAVWMAARRHAVRGIVVMSAVMYLPFLLLAPLFWVSAIAGSTLAAGGHLLMLPAMALAMPLTHRAGGRRAPGPLTADRSGEAGDGDGDRQSPGMEEALGLTLSPTVTNLIPGAMRVRQDTCNRVDEARNGPRIRRTTS